MKPYRIEVIVKLAHFKSKNETYFIKAELTLSAEVGEIFMDFHF